MWERFARRLGSDVGLAWGGELRWVTQTEVVAEFGDWVNLLQT